MSRHTLWAGPADGHTVEASPWLQTEIRIDLAAHGLTPEFNLRNARPDQHPRALYRWNGTRERYEYQPKDVTPA